MSAPRLSDLPAPPPGKTSWPWTIAPQPLPACRTDGSPWPRFSLVTPSFNQAEYIEETIRSVLLQGYPELEYFVIDGGSTDTTLEILRRYAPWLTVWISEPDRGQSHAINKGFRLASGEWLGWINSDDYLLPGALQTAALQTIGRPDLRWLVGETRRVDPSGKDIGAFTPECQLSQHAPNLWVEVARLSPGGVRLPQPSSFWARESVAQIGGLDESLHYAMDLDLYIRLARLGLQPHLIPIPLAAFREHPLQKTAHTRLPFLRERVRFTPAPGSAFSSSENEALGKLQSRLQSETALLDALEALVRNDLPAARELIAKSRELEPALSADPSSIQQRVNEFLQGQVFAGLAWKQARTLTAQAAALCALPKTARRLRAEAYLHCGLCYFQLGRRSESLQALLSGLLLRPLALLQNRPASTLFKLLTGRGGTSV